LNVIESGVGELIQPPDMNAFHVDDQTSIAANEPSAVTAAGTPLNSELKDAGRKLPLTMT